LFQFFSCNHFFTNRHNSSRNITVLHTVPQHAACDSRRSRCPPATNQPKQNRKPVLTLTSSSRCPPVARVRSTRAAPTAARATRGADVADRMLQFSVREAADRR
jgi:hypothetical protein